jgi:hypothetical protein
MFESRINGNGTTIPYSYFIEPLSTCIVDGLLSTRMHDIYSTTKPELWFRDYDGDGKDKNAYVRFKGDISNLWPASAVKAEIESDINEFKYQYKKMWEDRNIESTAVRQISNWNQNNKYGYDDMYHLMMVITLDNNVPILLEKNEVINIHINPTISPNAEKMELNVPENFNTTFKEFLDRTQSFMGNDYFSYDSMKNNCQRFIKSIILANPPLEKENPNSIKWVEQDTSGLQRDLSPTTQKIFKATTDLAARLNVLAKGKGFDNDNLEHHYKQD